MKIFKKVSILLLAIMLIATLKVYAGATEVKLTPSSTEVEVGDTVTVTLSAVRGNGIEAFDAVLTYNKTKLQLMNENALAGTNFASISGTDDLTGEFRVSLLYTGTGTGPAEADVAQLQFKVLEGASVDDVLEIKLSDITLIDSEETGTELEDVSTSVKVVDNDQQQGGNTENPGGDTDTPGDDTDNPGGNTDTPGGDTNPDDGASDNYPYAGIENYIFVIAFAIILASVVIYRKINKYKGIK